MPAIATEKYTLDGLPKVVSSEVQNEHYISVLLELERKDAPTPSEKNLAEILTLLVEAYENRKYPIRKSRPVEVLRSLMEANNLRQKDLASLLGSESVVSDILSERRKLNTGHIRKLSQRFKVSPALFF